MKKLFRVSLWLFFVTLSLFLLIYTYALCAPLSLYEQRQHITLYDKNGGNVLYESNFGENSEWISLDEIPQQVQDAFIAVEDKRFYLHFGSIRSGWPELPKTTCSPILSCRADPRSLSGLPRISF